MSQSTCVPKDTINSQHMHCKGHNQQLTHALQRTQWTVGTRNTNDTMNSRHMHSKGHNQVNACFTMIVKRRKLQWYGHVSRSLGLAKTILQGTVKGGKRQGRQRKRWEDNIWEWTGPEFGKSQRAVENREKWRKLVAKSSVIPQRP